MSFETLAQVTRPVGWLEVCVSAEGEATIIALRGEADFATLPAVDDALAHTIADHGGDVVVDLAQTEFIDTATVRAVLRARAVLEGSGRQPALRSPSRTAGRILAVFGLADLVVPERTLADTTGRNVRINAVNAINAKEK